RDSLERLAFGTERLVERPPPAFADARVAIATLPLWDADRVAAAVRRRPELAAAHGAVARVVLAPRAAGGGRAPWLVALMPGRPAADDGGAPPPPAWRELHRGAWARSGRPLVAVETDSGLDFQPPPLVARDSTAWFGPGFAEFAVASPDTWPATRASGIPLRGWTRRIALAWSLQSPELARAETD